MFSIEARSTLDSSEYIMVDENARPELTQVDTIFKDMGLGIQFEERFVHAPWPFQRKIREH